MTPNPQENQAQPQTVNDDKEKNFRILEAKYEKQLAQERAARMEAERVLQESKQRASQDDDDDSDPYVDRKKLSKELNRFGEQTKQQTQSEIKQAVQSAIKTERQENWIKNNPDFYDTLKLAGKLYEHNPELAENILEMPEGFERNKLVYQNIKALGLNKARPAEPSIQEKVDANRRSPFYQPTGVGASPYSQSADYSPSGQKQAYDKMQELKNRLRI